MKLRNVNQDVVDNVIFDALYIRIPLKHGVDYNFDSLEIDQCPFNYYWAEAYIDAIRLVVEWDKSTRAIRYEVEYPSHIEDGVVAVCKCESMEEAIRVFVFTVETAGHIRSAVESVLGKIRKFSRSGEKE